MPPLNYLIYCRVSPKGSQRRELETSTGMQEEYCRRWVEAQQGNVVDVLTDEQETGRSIDRPGMQLLLSALDSGHAKWDAIVVYRLDRFIRSMPDGAPIFKRLDQHNKGFASVQESIDLSSPFGRAMLWILLAFAELESNQTAQRTTNRMAQIAARGEWLSRPPFGYRRPASGENVLEPDPEQAPIVAECFRRYQAGDRPIDIYTDYGMTRSTFWLMLQNTVYIGRVVWGSVDVLGKHPPIIDHQTWQRVQDILPPEALGKKKGKSRPGAQSRVMLLSGLLWCHCGRQMTVSGALGRGRKRYHYYKCLNPDCERKTIQAQLLEQKVLYTIREYMHNTKLCEQIATAAAAEYDRLQVDSEPERRQLREAISTTQQRIDQLNQLFLSGVVEADNAQHFNEQLRELRNRSIAYHEQLTQLKAKTTAGLGIYTSAEAVQSHLTSLQEVIHQSSADPQQLRITLRQIIAKVILHPASLELTVISDNPVCLSVQDGYPTRI